MNRWKKIACFFSIALLVLAGIFISLCVTGAVAHAAGLLDDTVNPENLYSMYGLKNYQLDFYVDNSWAWLPWNWKSGIGKQVMYGIYLLTNAIWTLGLYISDATGYVVQQAYQLDFINDMADKLGTSMQTLIGITPNGVTKSGIFYRILPLIILIVGVYIVYVGLVKRETSKAIQTLLNMVVVFVLTVVFVAGAPSYIKMINGLSSDISTAVLDAGAKIMLSGEETQGGNSVDRMRDNLFSIQILQPWLLLQYGTTDMEEVGEERVKSLLSRNPSQVTDDETQTREYIVKDEIENKGNANLSTAEVVGRFGMVLFLFFLNIGISVFVFLLTGLMLLAQMLFIIFSMFLAFSFLLSMLPGQSGKWRQAAIKTFNTILTRAGITLVTTVAFCLSALVYSMSSEYPFFMVAFLQIVVFAGTFYKLPDIMGMFALQSNDSQSLGRRMFHRPYMAMRRGERRMRRKIVNATRRNRSERKRNSTEGGLVRNEGAAQTARMMKTDRMAEARTDMKGKEEQLKRTDTAFGRAGAKIGAAIDTPDRLADKTRMMADKVKNAPTNTRYAAYKAKEDFKNEFKMEQKERKEGRANARETYQEEVETKRDALQEAAVKKRTSASQRGMVKEKDIQIEPQQQKERPVSQKIKQPVKNKRKTSIPASPGMTVKNNNAPHNRKVTAVAGESADERQNNVRRNKKVPYQEPVEKRDKKWNDIGKIPQNAGLNQNVRQRPEVAEWMERNNGRTADADRLEKGKILKTSWQERQTGIRVIRQTPVIQKQKLRVKKESYNSREMKQEKNSINRKESRK